MTRAFGSRAERYARRLPGDLHVIVTEVEHLAEAYLEAVARRERGAGFYGMILFDDRRATLAGGVVTQILQQTPDHDARLVHAAHYAGGQLPIAGRPAAEIWAAVPPEIAALAPDFFQLAGAMLVRSCAEAARWATLLPRLRPWHRVLCEPVLPDVRAGTNGASVVVWAPEERAETLAVVALALVDLPEPAVVVCAGGSLPGLPNLTFLEANDPAVPVLLGAAKVVVCPDVGDPGAAVACARRGCGVAAPLASGALEFVAGVACYDPAEPRSIIDAVGIALARPAEPRPVMAAPLPPAPSLPALPTATDGLPLVSVIITTYNRPDDLERALASAAAQTYPNVEIIVVNDAGTPVDAFVAVVPNARLHDRPDNGGMIAAIVSGYGVARGEYVFHVADDDVLYPDHVERLMGAMLRCGAVAAHGNTLVRYQRRSADGSFETTGFNAAAFSSSVSASEALISSPIPPQSIIFRRDVFEALGGRNVETFRSDEDLQLRLWQRYPVVWVDHVTSEWRAREKGKTFSSTAEPAGSVFPPRLVLNPRGG